MKAAFISENGGPEVIRYGDLEAPKPGPGEVLVRLAYASLNHVDIWVRRGIGGYKTSFPHVLGADGAGIVEAIGPGVEQVSEGEPVVLYPLIVDRSCNFCIKGREDQCVSRKLLGNQVQGTYAEYVVVPAYNAIALEGLDFEVASAVPVTFMTAWHSLVTLAGLTPSETVLVWGGSGGLGSAALQIAKITGATVIATAGSEEKAIFLERLGADYAINYKSNDVVKSVMEITKGRGVDVVFENVGASTWDQSLRCLSPTGRLVTPGATTGKDVTLDVRDLYTRQITIMGAYGGTKMELLIALKLVRAGKLRPIITKVVPLSEVQEAHREMESGNVIGKVVIAIGK
ncbi:MAG: zinc-binding dehydrogenase [Thermoprotei archaeon]|jgi:NADPH:quinone reductase-like Zn-dependent oxidoreductase